MPNITNIIESLQTTKEKRCRWLITFYVSVAEWIIPWIDLLSKYFATRSAIGKINNLSSLSSHDLYIAHKIIAQQVTMQQQLPAFSSKKREQIYKAFSLNMYYLKRGWNGRRDVRNFFALYTDIPLPFDLTSIVEGVLLIDNLAVFILFFYALHFIIFIRLFSK